MFQAYSEGTVGLLYAQSSQLLLPLTKTVCLVAYPRQPYSTEFVDATDDMVDDLNTKIVATAWRHIYLPSPLGDTFLERPCQHVVVEPSVQIVKPLLIETLDSFYQWCCSVRPSILSIEQRRFRIQYPHLRENAGQWLFGIPDSYR